MIRFLGNIEVRADAKGRGVHTRHLQEAITSRFRRELIMRKDVFQDCLTLYPERVERGVERAT